MSLLKQFILPLSAACMLIACEKEKELTAPDFDVSIEQKTVKVGDTLTFKLQGSPDIISFYSGEKGNSYEFYNKDRVYDATTSLTFQSAKFAGNNADCAILKYSTDFKGVYDAASIRSATWTDISSRFNIPGINGTAAVFENSGEKDISDLFKDAKTPVYFGWFFTTNLNSSRTRAQIQNFQVKGIVTADPDLSGVKYSFADCAFKMILGEGFLTQDPGATVPRITSTLIYWDGVFANTSFKEGWAVSAPLYASAQVNLGPDWAVGIKSTFDPMITSVDHVYDKPGVYKVTFIGANAFKTDKKEVVKQLEITVTP